jgi:hypothetical protein
VANSENLRTYTYIIFFCMTFIQQVAHLSAVAEIPCLPFILHFLTFDSRQTSESERGSPNRLRMPSESAEDHHEFKFQQHIQFRHFPYQVESSQRRILPNFNRENILEGSSIPFSARESPSTKAHHGWHWRQRQGRNGR